MNQTIEERMLNIEDQLKEIRKELEESLARYNKVQKQNEQCCEGGPQWGHAWDCKSQLG
jgi:F0F1-type ATP synthase membrane subunit b/b'